ELRRPYQGPPPTERWYGPRSSSRTSRQPAREEETSLLVDMGGQSANSQPFSRWTDHGRCQIGSSDARAKRLLGRRGAGAWRRHPHHWTARPRCGRRRLTSARVYRTPAPVPIEAVEAALRPFGQSRMLPRAAYVDDDVLEWERRHFFDGGWVCVG